MNKVVFVPLDERPCTFHNPVQLAARTDMNLVVPPQSLFGLKKRAADCAGLARWLQKEASDADYLIVSLDMLLYGGIVPSRLHELSSAECKSRLQVLKEIKHKNPGLIIYAFNLIMRVPGYSSAEEEPDYYAEHGYSIYRHSWLQDKASQAGLTAGEQAEMEKLSDILPHDVLADFTGRRAKNSEITALAVEYTREGVLDALLIPLDDNAKYGFSAQEQAKIRRLAERYNLMDRVLLHSGADEAGCTLMARAFCHMKQYTPEIFVRYSSTLAPSSIPKLEDRSLHESIKSHLCAAGAYAADHSLEANAVLAVHGTAAGQEQMVETVHNLEERPSCYFTEAAATEFAAYLKGCLRKGKPVALADVAVLNGADHYLMQLLAKQGILKQLNAYAGWNTVGNSLGTVIAHIIMEAFYKEHPEQDSEARRRASREYYISRLIEDWGYQAMTRNRIYQSDFISFQGSNHVNIADRRAELTAYLQEQLEQFAAEWLHDFGEDRIHITDLVFPWDRVFEIGFRVRLEGASE
ncbi:DUF4127 family protein [Paenibacillus sp. GCM10027626]|uniref:DUF4127 family protein n=1 Tax=Paenibacillus sp. GCM10027626 TaxID=3273411 RepID=UPI003629DF3E